MNRRGSALFIEVDVTDEDVRRGRLLEVAWLFRSRLGCWTDGAPRPLQLREELAMAALVVGYDLHRVIAPHLAHRHGLHVGWPRADLRSMLALLPVEVEARFYAATNVGPHGIVRRLDAVRAAWNVLRSRR